jgi:hypothetical protein
VSLTNDSALYNLGISGFTVQDNLSWQTTTQATAAAISTEVSRVLQSAASGAGILPSIGMNAAQPFYFVLNDSAQTIDVYPWNGEKLNGTANQAFPIAAGAFGIFMQEPVQTRRGGGTQGTTNWHAVQMT